MMKKNINAFTAMCLSFIILLAAAGLFDGFLSDIVYCLAFVLPTILGILADNKLRREESEHDREYPEPKNIWTLGRTGLGIMLPTLFPTVALVFLVSFVTSLLIGALGGAQSTPNVGDNLIAALLSHALAPALLEELLFRYMPMRMLARHSARLTIIISSIYFALVHNSFFSMPYALVAGLIFMTVDLLAESVIPSVIMHFCNNALSVLWIFFGSSATVTNIIWISLAFLSFISVIFIIMKRVQYVSGVKKLLSSGDDFKLGTAPIAIAVPTLFVAVCELL